MNKSITIETIELNQPIGNLYIGKIDAYTLYNMAKADIRRLNIHNEYLGIQRELNKERVKEIKRYLKTIDASFPNTIILNLDSQYIIDIKQTSLTVALDNSAFTIIDGQHRLAGFEDNYVGNFELIITLFIDLDIEQQALLFTTINSEQRRVDPSYKYDLEVYSSVKTPRKVVREIAIAFNLDKESPWYEKIKITGKKDILSRQGLITLKAFVEPILEFIYPNKTEAFEIRDTLLKFNSDIGTDIQLKDVFPESLYDSNVHIFWEFYRRDKEEVIYKILLNYFRAFKDTLNLDWGNDNSILNKTTGYNAMMKLFYDAYKIGLEEKKLSYTFFKEFLAPLKRLNGQITSRGYGASGEQSTRYLYDEFRHILKKY
ncbi:DGQHR domain-containing protein [Bacillus toyonensis]|uniref:DGQHR domain-containing protein n=1 Tax=Bacillus TaxID=1386 RepID=UPI0007784F98|nr:MULTISPECIES: DGQHR domain-containing protein [Bacillus]KXY20077.1 hypothetical protein AT259_15345 [Bacillus cereus]MDH8705452.1 DGQHR domain-containing protein [Stenotrophomonas sp. 1198]MDP9749148.1 DGQHR domain-containing protein [Bacillus thuringiensis]MDF9888641.1 DGQHR domain-containing protein [Bacillus sp. LEw-kw-24]MDH6559079.1 DGQHR domain-containing protein [Bacillus sp. LEw-kw-2]